MNRRVFVTVVYLFLWCCRNVVLRYCGISWLTRYIRLYQLVYNINIHNFIIRITSSKIIFRLVYRICTTVFYSFYTCNSIIVAPIDGRFQTRVTEALDTVVYIDECPDQIVCGCVS